MGKTVNYQCNLGISKVIETLDEDENIVEGLSQEAGNPHILSQDPSWADLLREDVTVSGSDAECEGHSNEDGMEETVTQDVMAGELRMVKVELGRMKRKYDDKSGVSSLLFGVTGEILGYGDKFLGSYVRRESLEIQGGNNCKKLSQRQDLAGRDKLLI